VTLAFVVLSPLGDDRGDTPQELVAYVDAVTTAEEVWYGAFLIFVLLYPLLLGCFVGGLHLRLRATGADAEAVLALVGGVTFTVLVFLTDVVVFGGLGELTNVDEDQRFAYAQTVLDLERIVWFVQAGAGVGAALMIVAASFGMRRVGAIGRWTFWPSLLLGIVSLNTIGFVGVLAWFAWIGLAAIWMLTRRA
jgi:hypothetical protein